MATTQFLGIERRIGSLADVAYGIVPMPKLTKEQKEYRTFVQDQVTAFGVSAAIGDEARQSVLGAVMESIAYNSNKTVRPAYYDSAMSLRFMQDPQSRYMLDMMFEVLAFDYSYYTNLDTIRDGLHSMLYTTNPNVVSNNKKWSKAAKNELNKQILALDKLDQK